MKTTYFYKCLITASFLVLNVSTAFSQTTPKHKT